MLLLVLALGTVSLAYDTVSLAHKIVSFAFGIVTESCATECDTCGILIIKCKTWKFSAPCGTLIDACHEQLSVIMIRTSHHFYEATGIGRKNETDQELLQMIWNIPISDSSCRSTRNVPLLAEMK